MLKTLFDFAGDSSLGFWMRNSRTAFPLFESIHLLGLAVLLGSMFFLNARFLRIALRRQRLIEVSEDFAPWTALSLLVMVVSGIPLFCAKAPDLWEGELESFGWKMGLIAAAIVWHYAIMSPLARSEDVGRGRLAATISLGLWFSAAMMGLSLEFL